MAGKIICVLVAWICGVAFLLVAENADEHTPAVFWAGEAEKLKKTLHDIPSYNRKMKKIWSEYAMVWFLIGTVFVFSMEAGMMISFLNLTAGLCAVYFLYRRARRQYS